MKESLRERLKKLAGVNKKSIKEQRKDPDKGSDPTTNKYDKDSIKNWNNVSQTSDAVESCCTEFQPLLDTYDQIMEEYQEALWYYNIVYGGVIVSIEGFGNCDNTPGDWQECMGSIIFGDGTVGQFGTGYMGYSPFQSAIWSPAPERPFQIYGNNASSMIWPNDGGWAWSADITQGSCFNPSYPMSILGCMGDHNGAHAYLLDTSPGITNILSDTYYAAVNAFEDVAVLVQAGCCEELAPRVQGVPDLPAFKKIKQKF
tara:strand:- start:88 stop:861 length:774 start_codon:yes stop_codon:yes gene_type:complete